MTASAESAAPFRGHQSRAEKTASLLGALRHGVSRTRTTALKALTAGRALLSKAAPAPAPALSPLGVPWGDLRGRSFREIHNAILGQTAAGRQVPMQYPSMLHAAKYRAALGTPRELGRENAYLSAAMDPSDARHAAVKAKGIHTRAQAYGTPAFPKTSSTSYTPELQREYPVMTKHAALLSILKTAAAHEDKRHEKIAVLAGVLNAGRGLIGAARPGAAVAQRAMQAQQAAATATQGARAIRGGREFKSMLDLVQGRRIKPGSELHKLLAASGANFRAATDKTMPLLSAQRARSITKQMTPMVRDITRLQGTAATRGGHARQYTQQAAGLNRGYDTGAAVRTGAKNLWDKGQAAMGTAAIRGQQLAGQGIQGAQQALRHPVGAGLAGAGAIYGLNKMGSDRHEKIAVLAGVLRGASGLLRNLPGALGAAAGTGAVPGRVATTAIRRGVPRAQGQVVPAGMPMGPGAMKQIRSGAMQALRNPVPTVAGAGAAAYGLSKMGSAELALVKIAARIINADVGLDAIIAHIKAAKARQGIPA